MNHFDLRASVRLLRRAELPADTVALARFLIGKFIVRELPAATLVGRIVETEAYPPRDPAAHHFRGPTPRNRSMFLRRGHAYVYFSYGNHFMLNVSAELPNVGGGVLIRSLEPIAGIPQMQLRRKTSRLLDLTRGPGRLAAALQIDRSLDGVDLCAPGALWLGALTRDNANRVAALELPGSGSIQPSPPTRRAAVVTAPDRSPAAQRRADTSALIGTTTRIGITRAAHRLLRFYERGNPFVSGPAHLRF